MIGAVQRNKIRKLSGILSLWQSVDRIEVLEEIKKRDPAGKVLIQINPLGETGKGGCSFHEARGLIEHGLEIGLSVEGVMAVGVQGDLGKTSDIFSAEIEKDENNLANINNNEFVEKIKNKFQEKRLERESYLGNEQAEELEKRIFLQIIDENWKSHIQYLEQLRSVIGLRSYGQRDPLVEYKKEAFYLFKNLLNKLKLDFITILMNLTFVQTPSENNSQLKKTKIDPKNINKKISRNEPCPCGSGKKYKRCCGAL